MGRKIVVYSQPGCMPCAKLKAFLAEGKMEYTDRNIAADGTALAELEKLGYMTTPVIVMTLVTSKATLLWWASAGVAGKSAAPATAERANQ